MWYSTLGCLVTLILSLLAAPLAAGAQPARQVARVGRLSPSSAAATARIFEGLRHGLRDLGWVEGENIAFEDRYADGQLDRLSALAADLVRLQVDVLFVGSIPGARAAKDVTGRIPIVIVATGDLVTSGLVASLARPGGNLTGVTALSEALSGKRLELLTEAVPGVTRVALLATPAYPVTGPLQHEVESAARALGVELRVLEVRAPSEFEQVFATLSHERVGALMVGTDPMFNTHRQRIVELAAQSRLPTMYGHWEFVDAGGLMFYGAPLSHMARRAATFVDKILKGTPPADLPVEQPTKFALVLNLKTAKTLSLIIPPSLLFQADEVIQ